MHDRRIAARESAGRWPFYSLDRKYPLLNRLQTMDSRGDQPLTAEERKRKRLLAWKKKQEQQQQKPKSEQPKLSLSLSIGASKKKKVAKPKKAKRINPFDEDDGDNDSNYQDTKKRKRPEDLMAEEEPSPGPSKRPRGVRRWDSAPPKQEKDVLDQFMDKLEAGADATVTLESSKAESLSINVGGSMMLKKNPVGTPKSNVITAEEILGKANTATAYDAKDWLSDAMDTDDEEQEEKARRALVEALASTPGPAAEEEDEEQSPQTAAEVKTEKQRRKQRLEELERQAADARRKAEEAAAPDLGRLYNDAEEGVMEEAERNLEAAKAAPDALQVLAELNKKKELKSVDHSQIDYLPFQKNLFVVPRSLAGLTNDEVINRRAKLKVRVRGHGAPAPVSSFEECGLSERILSILDKQGINKPFPVQAQCIPCAMAGRDVIGIAKTGSGKTLAYLLPLFRHILVQPPLEPTESGPIGLIIAPARELAYQIHSVCKSIAKQLGLK